MARSPQQIADEIEEMAPKERPSNPPETGTGYDDAIALLVQKLRESANGDEAFKSLIILMFSYKYGANTARMKRWFGYALQALGDDFPKSMHEWGLERRRRAARGI